MQADKPSTDPRVGETGLPGPVFLIGYRCTGKTTTARHLAGRCGGDWCDMDELLEARAGRSIRQIFAEEGEAGFRAREAEILEELCRGPARVVATGGGVVLAPANRERLRRAGFVIWLTADTPTIWRRMTEDPTTAERRPALTTGGLAEIEDLLRRREPLYRECAGLTVDTSARTPEEVAAVILEAWKRS
jgi:shikimate kinase